MTPDQDRETLSYATPAPRPRTHPIGVISLVVGAAVPAVNFVYPHLVLIFFPLIFCLLMWLAASCSYCPTGGSGRG